MALGCAVLFLLAPAGADAREPCIETGDTVGETNCSRYGSWSIEKAFPYTFRFGLRYGSFTPDGVLFNDNTPRSKYPPGYTGYFVGGKALGVPSLTGIGPDGGFTVFVVDQLYLGAETGLLFGGARTAKFHADGYELRDARRGIDVMLLHAGVPIGYRIPLGRASLRGEVLGGGVFALVDHEISGPGAPSSEQSVGARWLLEPRVAADIWFTQHISFGAYAGVNVLDSNVPAFGISLSFHNRAFDGDWSLW